MDQNEEQLLAAEYTLGLLSPDEAAAFELLLSEDATFRADYARWAEDFAALTDDIAPVPAPADVLVRVKQAVFMPQVDAQGFVTVAVNEGGATAIRSDTKPPPTPVQGPREAAKPAGPPLGQRVQNLLERLGLLPAIAGGLAAALAVLWVINLSGVFAPAVPNAAITLAAADQSLVVEITYTDNGENLNITRTAGVVPEGRALELWLLKENEAPISLGLLPVDETGTLQVAEALRPLLHNAQCAISIEPPGGSPTGAPTGEIVAVAPIVWTT